MIVEAACVERHELCRKTCVRYRILRPADPRQPRVSVLTPGLRCEHRVPIDDLRGYRPWKVVDAEYDAEVSR